MGNPAAVASFSLSYTVDSITDPVVLAKDALTPLMQRVSDANVVITMSAGNAAKTGMTIDSSLPRALGGITTPYIVVGATDENGQRSSYSQYLETGSKSILSLYTLGDQVMAATLDPNNPYSYFYGTSGATAIVAGMAARLIANGVSVPNIKTKLQSDGWSLKGTNFAADTTYVVPRAGIPAQVSCSSPVLSATAPTPTYTYYPTYTFSFQATPTFSYATDTPVSCYTFTSQTSRTSMLVVTQPTPI
jgi:hypothetical protein